jgi:two-component system phosphate regulon sensor histidine kinase PhoR
MSTSSSFESAIAQAKKYGEDLAKLYAIEKAKRTKLEISNQKLQAVFSTTPDGLAVLDEEYNIAEANPAFWTLIEQPNPEHPIPLTDVLPYPGLLTQLKELSPSGPKTQKIELDLQVTDKVIRNLLFNAVVLSAGEQRGLVLSVHDLTERKRLETLKSEFINIAAHELRTPLAAILGFTQVLKETVEETADDLVLHLIETILKSSNRLKGIIDELIEFADIRFQKEGSQNTHPFDLIEVINEVVELIDHIAQEKSLIIEANFNRNELIITGNYNIIKEVLTQIAENAIIFNKPGGKIIIRASEQDNFALIEIEDTGLGIPQKEISKIFDKFYQVEEHLTRSVGGLGLGLAIAQRGVQFHGGNITVTSQINEGSCFTIILPKTLPSAPSERAEGLKAAHAQTIAYGRDLAKAVASEKAMAMKFKKLGGIRHELLEALDKNASLDEIRAIVNQMDF